MNIEKERLGPKLPYPPRTAHNTYITAATDGPPYRTDTAGGGARVYGEAGGPGPGGGSFGTGAHTGHQQINSARSCGKRRLDPGADSRLLLLPQSFITTNNRDG